MMEVIEVKDDRVVIRIQNDGYPDYIHRLVKGKLFYSGEIPGPNDGQEYRGVNDGKILMGDRELTPDEFEELFPRLSCDWGGTEPVKDQDRYR